VTTNEAEQRLAAVRATYDWLRESANGGHGEPLDLVVERLGEALGA
jgi:hypothetical protein